MNRDELEIKLHEILEIVTSTPELLTLDIMCWVDKYAESLAPAKEVVSKDEANLIEESRVLGYQDDHIIRRAKDKLELSYDDGSYQKFMRAVVNGYKAEPGNRFWLPVPRTSDDKGDKSFVAYISYSGDWNIGRSYDTNPAHYQATQAEIDAAPDWVKALKPVEVKEDEA